MGVVPFGVAPSGRRTVINGVRVRFAAIHHKPIPYWWLTRNLSATLSVPASRFYSGRRSQPLTMLKEQLVQYAAENPRVVTGVVLGVVAAAANYAKTGKVPIGRLPFRHLRRMVSDFGDTYFGKKRPRGVPGIVVDVPPDELNKRLRPRHYEPADLFSYEYEGEVWGLRRPDDFAPDPVAGEPVAMENHVRAFELESGKTFLLPHYEANRFSETSDHFDPENFSWETGVSKTAKDLKALQVSHEQVESEAAAGVTVVS